MKRVVYSPKVYVFVKADSGIYDLTDHVIDCSVSRKINQISTASVTFRNPKKQFTNGENGAVFHPMDPIVIFMKRLDGRPVQVFTGYCDTTPYFQLRPGPATIEASCTLKRLLYTYWDPGLPFVAKMLEQRGWQTTATQGGYELFNTDAAAANNEDSDGDGIAEVDDGSIGAILFDVLLYIGNWRPDSIYIEEIPKGLYRTAQNLIEDIDESQDVVREILEYIIGQSSYGDGNPEESGNYGGEGPPPFAIVTPVDVGRAMLNAGFPRDKSIIAEGINVVRGESNFGNYGPWRQLNSAGCVGYWQHQIAPPDGSWAGHDISLKDACTLVPSTIKTKEMWSGSGNSFQTHWYNWNGGGYSRDITTYLSAASRALQLGPFTNSSVPNSSGAGRPGANTG